MSSGWDIHTLWYDRDELRVEPGVFDEYQLEEEQQLSLIKLDIGIRVMPTDDRVLEALKEKEPGPESIELLNEYGMLLE